MTELGIVKKIDGDLVQVAFHEECQSCEKCGSCLATSKPRQFVVANPRGLRLVPGDRVEYSVSPGKAVKAAFLLLILPILLFFPFYYAAAALLPLGGEAVAVVFGLTGVALGFVLNILLRRGRRQYPEILRVLES
jgi:positive regulator of sigma E activity